MIVSECGRKRFHKKFSVLNTQYPTYLVGLSSSELETDLSSDKEVSDQEISCQHKQFER